MIPVNKPFLPPQDEYIKYLEGIWSRNWLTNSGPLVNELELKLKDYLNVPSLLYLNNGTIALQIAIKALGLKDEIITTPFSYVATTSSIVWEGCSPVFVDIDPSTFNIDPARIEACITSKTSAILATHVYGNPCDVDAISLIAKKYNLKVIYDGAHAFGTTMHGESIFSFGDITTCSFHATKLFHTVEGGAIIARDPDVVERVGFMRNFGHDGYEKFNGVGINGKSSEFHAAMGLVNLKYIDQILLARKLVSSFYDKGLMNIGLQKQRIEKSVSYNFAYYPVVFNSESDLLQVVNLLNKNNIFPRRYFYPVLSDLPYVSGDTPIASDISKRILCLPLFYDLIDEDVHRICTLIKKG